MVVVAVATIAATLLRGRGVSQASGLDVSPPPIGVVAGTSDTSVLQTDLLGPLAPQVMSLEAAQAALPARIVGLQARYEAWLATRLPATHSDEPPQLPSDMELPPPPDAIAAEAAVDMGEEAP